MTITCLPRAWQVHGRARSFVAVSAVTLADRLFLTAESAETPQHVAALGIFLPPSAAPEDFIARLVAGFRAVQTFAPPFKYRLRHPRLKAIAPEWKELSDDQVDLDFHFRHNALPRPGGQRELGQLISRLHSRALDPTRPLWECHLIEGLEDGRFAMYFKVHHALMDGVGGVRRFTAMVSRDPELTELFPIWTIGPQRVPRTGGGRSLTGRARGAISSTVGAAAMASGLGRVGAGMVREALCASDPALATPFAAPRSVLGGRIGQQRRIATQTIEFARMRALASAAGVTVNDVFLAICAGGLRRYLAEIGGLPASGLIAGTPVNVRVGDGDDISNAFTMTVMKLCTEIADPIERLEAISRSSTITKDRLARLPKPVVENQAALFMGPLIAQQLTPAVGPVFAPYNVVVSNVPGPLDPQYLAGARLESLAPIGLIYHGVALMIAAFTISGAFTVGFVACRDSVPHVQRLAIYTGEALEELEQRMSANDKNASRAGMAGRRARP